MNTATALESDAADVVVIGGGLVGAAAALALSGRCSVALLERGEIGAAQSSRALGWVRVSGRDPRDVPLALETRRLWEQFGSHAGYRRAGLLFACGEPGELAEHESWLERVRHYALDAHLIDARTAAGLAPHLSMRLAGALYSPLDGRVEPALAARALAALAAERGAVIAPGTQVQAIHTHAGAVAGVVTARGEVRCRAVIVAAAGSSGGLCRPLGVRLPIQVVESFVSSTAPLTGPEISVYAAGVGLRRTLDGRYVLGVQRRIAVITRESLRWLGLFLPAWRQHRKLTRLRLGFGPMRADPWREEVWRRARGLYPFLRDGAVTDNWGGAIDVTPDALPIIGAAPAVPGLYIAAGFSGGGLGNGLGGGFLAADLALGNTPRVDPDPYRPERFFPHN